MKEKKILRKDLRRKIFYFFIGALIVAISIEKNSVFYMALLVVCIYVFHHLLCRKKIRYALKKYRDVFKILKMIHTMRYKCYLNGDEEEAREHSKMVNESANALFETGEILINNAKATKKEREEIKNIMKKTEELLENIVPLA